MTISYPLPFPSHTGRTKLRNTQLSVVGVSGSPFSGRQHVYEYTGQWFEFEVSIPPMKSQEAADKWNAFFLKLNGSAGTFLLGEKSRPNRGTCITALVNGSHAARAKSLSIRSMTPGGTLLESDYLQLGSGNASRLHRNLVDVTADGSDEAVLDIWPGLRQSYSDGETVTLIQPVGVFRLLGNTAQYEADPGIIYSGFTVAAREAL